MDVAQCTESQCEDSAGEAGTEVAPAQDKQMDTDILWSPDASVSGARGPEKVLLDQGQITPEQLERAVSMQASAPHRTVLETLVQSQAIDEIVAFQAVATYCNLPFQRITPGDVDEAVFALLPHDYLKTKNVLPIRRDQRGIVVGMSDPADIFLIDDIKHRLQGKVKLVVTPPGDMLKAIEELSVSTTQQVDDIIKDIGEDDVAVVNTEDEEVTDLEREAGESPVIRYVNFLITSAVKDKASDIHIEPSESRLRVRCRIDGVLFEQVAPRLKLHAAIISRLKIMANLNIAERRLPQDGRIRATVQGRKVDLRVSTLPVSHGEKCVIRILDGRSIMVGLENLGMWSETLDAFRHQISQPHGVVLVTGPTGSGKSTTLYSALRVMDADTLNVSTVEDPVEYELDNINQVNVLEGIGMTFAAALRSLLRQDPDIIMVGEIRDEETARIAIQASLTGHLVLSTLHTNDAASSVTRLINIGIEPFLISAAVNAVLAQRLVRRICENCKTPVTTVPDNVAAYLDRNDMGGKETFQGAGCEKCRHTGYKGRLGTYEILVLADEIRDIVTSNPTLVELRAAAKAGGMRDIRTDGLEKVCAGLTTVEEIMRVTET